MGSDSGDGVSGLDESCSRSDVVRIRIELQAVAMKPADRENDAGRNTQSHHPLTLSDHPIRPASRLREQYGE